MATSTPIPRAPIDAHVRFVRFAGTRMEILGHCELHAFPASWGTHETLVAMVREAMPSGPGWRGTVTITGYRTPPNDEGTGTVYVSVAWKPAYKGEKLNTE